MQIHTVNTTPEFKPVQVVLTIETLEELKALDVMSRLNQTIPRVVGGNSYGNASAEKSIFEFLGLLQAETTQLLDRR